jgi:hypothetical protein
MLIGKQDIKDIDLQLSDRRMFSVCGRITWSFFFSMAEDNARCKTDGS